MRRMLACLALLAACVAPSASADPFESARPELLRACVSAAGDSREALNQCLGSLARPCIAVEGASTHTDVLCWSAEAHEWRVQTAEAMQHLNQTATHRDPARLATADAAWEAWAEAECEYWAWEEGGGVGEQVDRVRCYARVTAERAIDLILAAR